MQKSRPNEPVELLALEQQDSVLATRKAKLTQRAYCARKYRLKMLPIGGRIMLFAAVCGLCLFGSRGSCLKGTLATRTNGELDGSGDGELRENASEQNLMTALTTKQPRQQFRVHLAPSQRSALKPLRLSLKRAAATAKTRADADAASQSKPSLMSIASTNSSSIPQQQLGGGGQRNKKISSAALRKLLNQTLPKYSSAAQLANSSSLLPKASTFKFVSIKRATAAPSALKAAKSKVAATQPPEGATSARPSPAASVPKQLASSLLYSAASFVAASSGAANNTTESGGGGENSTAPTVAPVTKSSAEPLEKQQSRVVDLTATTKTTATKGRKSRPSKVYNLPVKFVSNGQPNNVVFQTIRQHFATIKKLQAENGSQQTKTRFRKPTQTSLDKMSDGKLATKMKGVNSRLIYLPLKYLSNARPISISTSSLATRASHKSAPARP